MKQNYYYHDNGQWTGAMPPNKTMELTPLTPRTFAELFFLFIAIIWLAVAVKIYFNKKDNNDE